MKKLSTLLIALCLIVTLAVSASAVNILASQTKLNEETNTYDWQSGENALIIHRIGNYNQWQGWGYFGDPEKPGAYVEYAAGMPTYLSMCFLDFDAMSTEKLLDLTNGFELTIEDIEWDANTNAAVAITIGNDHEKDPTTGEYLSGNNKRTNLTCAGALTLVVRKDGTAALYHNKSGNWYGETATYADKAALVAGATSFTYSMEKIEGGYKFYVNDTLLATFDASNAAEWPTDLTQHVDELGFNFYAMNGTLADAGAGLPGPIKYSIVSLDDMSVAPVPPEGDHIGAVVLLAAVAGGAALAFTKKKAK